MVSIASRGPQVEVSDLLLVMALAESGSTVNASAALHLGQSAVSRRLLAIEEKLETRLFERNARGLSLTAAGRRFVGAAGPVLAQLLELEATVRNGTSYATPIRLVCECYTAYRWLPAALPSLERKLGNELHIAIEHTAEPVRALRKGSVDLALLTTSNVPKTHGEMPLFHDEIVFLVAATHPLASRGAVTPSELARVPMIVSTATPAPEQRWFMRALFGASAPRLTRHAFPLTEAVIDAARARMGVAPMSEWVAREYVAEGDLVALRLPRKQLRRPWRLAYRRDAEDTARQFASVLRSTAPHLSARA